MSVLGIDVGTSGCKACAFSAEGVPLARRSASYGYISPRPDWMELDPELLWRKVRSVIRATAREAAAARDPVCALAMATMGDSLVAVDRANRPLSNYILYSDRRSVSQAGVLASRIGPGRLYEITGMPPHPMHTITKILWMMENQPELCASA
ncbi:MAG TPA: FGGY family carbohydrate kinase, partial [Spirochaetia bacterium]|nr:FGGY family carbohydrate kinase [Spirochaetia bacterium]